jgi:hypothetical protein
MSNVFGPLKGTADTVGGGGSFWSNLTDEIWSMDMLKSGGEGLSSTGSILENAMALEAMNRPRWNQVYPRPWNVQSMPQIGQEAAVMQGLKLLDRGPDTLGLFIR